MFLLLASLPFESKSQNSLEEHYYCPDTGSWQILSICYIENSLYSKSNKKIYDSLYTLWRVKFRNKPDPSLSWIIDACFSKRMENNNSQKAFRNDIKYKPVWQPETSIPEVYSFKIHKDTLDVFRKYYSKFSIWNGEEDSLLMNNNKYAEGWISYYAHNHVGIISSNKDSVSRIETLATHHGVIIKRNNLYSWIFVTDGILTGSPEKLRWKSIEKTFIYKDHVFILLNIGIPSYERVIYVVDYKKGICKALNDQVFFPIDEPLLNFSVSGNNITLTRALHSKETFIHKELLLNDLLKDF